MRKYINVSLGLKNLRVDIDDELLKKLKRTLKRNLEFDSDGCLKTDYESNEVTYRVKQLALKSLLDQLNTYELNPDLKNKFDYIYSNLSGKKSTVYSSDITSIERLLADATELYDNVKNTNIPKKGQEKREKELQEKISNSKDVAEKIEVAQEVIDNASEVLSDYLDDDKIDTALENIVVASSDDEYQILTSEVLDVEEERKIVTPKIVIPPNATVEDIALEVVSTAAKGTSIENLVEDLKKNKSDFKGDIVAGLNKLTSSIKTQGLNYRNLNYFGDNFIQECDRLCRETGQSLEDMFRDYFSASSSTRANSVLNRFILSFITRNGNDSSLRSLIEATLVKKAISNHLISSKFNNYLSEEYRNLTVSGSGYINFDAKTETTNEVVSNISSTEIDREDTLNVATEGTYNETAEINSSSSFDNNVTLTNNINGKINNEVNSTIDTSINSSGNLGGNVSADINNTINAKTNINNSESLSGGTSNNLNNPTIKPNLNNGINAGFPARNGLNPNINNRFNMSGDPGNVSPNVGGQNNLGASETGGRQAGINNHLGTDLGNENNGINASGVNPALMGASNNLQDNLDNSPSMAMAGVRNPSQNNYAMAMGQGVEGVNGAGGFGKSNKAKKQKKGGQAETTTPRKNLRRNGALNPDLLNENTLYNNEDEIDGNSPNSKNLDNNESTDDNANNKEKLNDNNQNIQNDDNNQNEKDSGLKDEIKKQLGKKIIELIKKHPYVIAVAGIILLLLLLILIVLSYQNQKKNQMMGLGGYPYIQLSNVCEEIHVYDTPSGEDGTYPLEEYIAGVVAHEVGAFNDDTLYEVFSIAARTYALRRLQNSSDCSIPGNTKAQVFGKTNNEKIIEAVNRTRGLVLTKDNSLVSTEYDAFCWDTKDGTNYNICQKNYDTGEVLKVPESWAEEYVAKISGRPFLTNPRYQSHGRGMSQQGAFYMAMELSSTRDQILAFFYGKDATLRSIYASSYTGEFPINPNDSLYQNLEFIINKPLSSVLEENGTSVAEFNNYLANIVETSGVGTREAVVNVAVSLIGSLANMGYKLNYQWGGKYFLPGVNPSWGNQRSTGVCTSYGKLYDINKCITHYKWASFDCSGFVNWALLNGFNLNNYEELKGRGIYSKTQTNLADRVNLNVNSAVCQAGDVLIKPGAHIVLIVGTDDAAKKYIVAESTGSNIDTKTGGVKLSYYNYGASGYFCGDMSSIYKNNNQVEEE